MSKKFPWVVYTQHLQEQITEKTLTRANLARVVSEGLAHADELAAWCETMFGPGGEKGQWRHCGYEFSFRQQQHAAFFKLRVPDS
jgi:hypothetical protein